MDLGSIFLILALLTLVGLFISRPFFEQRRPSANDKFNTQEEQKLSSLLADRDRIINSLRELDFDHSVGKILEEDYPAQRTLLLQQGADVLRQLDAFQVSPPPVETAETVEAGETTEAGKTIDARIETAIAAHRSALSSAPSVENGNGYTEIDDNVEVLIAARRRARHEKSAGFCPKCGNAVQNSDRFCTKCGATLK